MTWELVAQLTTLIFAAGIMLALVIGSAREK